MKGLEITIKEQLSLWNVLLLLISTFLLLESCVSNHKSIDSIYVYSIDWDEHYRYRLDVKGILGKKHNKSLIESKRALELISERILKLEQLPDFDGVDMRMLCIMNYSDGTTDTLKVGSPQIFMYNEVVYDKDSILLNLIEDNMVKIE